MTAKMFARSRFFSTIAALAGAIAVFGCQTHSEGRPQNAHARNGVGWEHAERPREIPAHVQTAEYLWTPVERDTDPRLYAPYLTWAYPLYSQAARVRAAGIKTIFYINPVMPQQGAREYEMLNGRYAAVAAKDCGGNPVSTYEGRGLLADPRSPQAADFYKDTVEYYIREKIRGDRNWDAFFVDNNGALYGANPLPCNYDPVAWGRAFDRAIENTRVPIVTNSLAAREEETRKYVDRLSARNVIGGMFEECFNDRMWSAEETSQIETVSLLRRMRKPPGPGWWCYVNNTSAPAASSIPQRMFDYASFLLTYDPQYSLFQEAFTTEPSTFKVYPETGFVPLGPASTPKRIDDLRSDGGAYVQLFRWCYMRRRPLGSCEVAVNPGGGAVTLPNPLHLSHTMVFAGGGILDGGTVRFDGGVPTSLAPQTAAILVR